MSIDFWKSVCDVLAVVAALVTFAAGTGALISGRIINQRQGSQLKKFESDLTQAKLDLAKAERSNLELRLSMQPRELGAKRMLEMAESLRSFSGSDMPLVVSWYPVDAEAAAFAKQISQSLKNAGFAPAEAAGRLEDWQASANVPPSTVITGVGIFVSRKYVPFASALKRAISGKGGPESEVTIVDPFPGTSPRNDGATYVFVGVRPSMPIQ